MSPMEFVAGSLKKFTIWDNLAITKITRKNWDWKP